MNGDTLGPLKIVSTRGMTVDTQEYHRDHAWRRSWPRMNTRSSLSM